MGLGVGATPSGDDLLAGLVVAFRRGLGAQGLSQRSATRLAAACLAAAGRTTPLARARLVHAAADEVDEALDGLFPAVFAGDRAGVWQGVARVVRAGHASGTDTLAGVILGLRLALERGYTSSP